MFIILQMYKCTTGQWCHSTRSVLLICSYEKKTHPVLGNDNAHNSLSGLKMHPRNYSCEVDAPKSQQIRMWLPLLPGGDGSSICWSWAGGDGGACRSSLWVTYRLFSSAERGCCWAGRLSWVCGSTDGSREPKSASRACILRDGLWKQKQNMSSGRQTCGHTGNLKDALGSAWKKVFSVSQLLENPESPEGWSELEDEHDVWLSCPPSKRNESKDRIQLYEQADFGGGWSLRNSSKK